MRKSSKSTFGRTAAVVAALALVVAACGGAGETSAPAPAAPAAPAAPDAAAPVDPQVVKIGMPIPTTGGGAAIGERFALAGQMAIDELNEMAGGAFIFEGYVEDSGCTPDLAATAALNLVLQREVDVLVGELCSSATLAVKDIAEQEQIPLIVPNSSAMKITSPDYNWTFRIIPHEEHQHEALARLAIDYFGNKKFAVLYEQTDAGVGARDAFIEEATKNGAEIVLDEAFDRTAPDFTPIAQRVARSGADAVHLTVLIEPGVRMVKTFEEQGINLPVYSSIWFAYPLFEDTAGSAANDNVRQLFYINTGTMPEAVEFTTKFRALFSNVQPDFNHAQYYAAVMLAGKAAMECGAGRTEIRDCLRTTKDFRTPIGPITFDGAGQVIPTDESLIHIQTLNGRVEVLDDRANFNANYIYGW
jgi:branched-chain amino acid transport system substrate-binding protein